MVTGVQNFRLESYKFNFNFAENFEINFLYFSVLRVLDSIICIKRRYHS